MEHRSTPVAPWAIRADLRSRPARARHASSLARKEAPRAESRPARAQAIRSSDTRARTQLRHDLRTVCSRPRRPRTRARESCSATVCAASSASGASAGLRRGAVAAACIPAAGAAAVTPAPSAYLRCPPSQPPAPTAAEPAVVANYRPGWDSSDRYQPADPTLASGPGTARQSPQCSPGGRRLAFRRAARRAVVKVI